LTNSSTAAFQRAVSASAFSGGATRTRERRTGRGRAGDHRQEQLAHHVVAEVMDR
jgi:hypothetical protein